MIRYFHTTIDKLEQYRAVTNDVIVFFSGYDDIFCIDSCYGIDDINSSLVKEIPPPDAGR